jgi:phosphoglycolate phosphatase
LDVSKSTESSPDGTTRRAAFFDWDGTIVDSVPALFEADAAIARELGLPFDREIFRRTFSPNWRRKYRLMGVTDDQVEQAVGVWSRLFHSSEMRPFAGVRGALTALARRGFTVGVVTSGSRGEIEPQFARLGLDGIVSVGVFGDDPVEGKPDPAPLLLALERAGGVLPEHAIYVGDALDDMRMAAAAGVRGVGIESMLADPHELHEAGASETAPSTTAWIARFLGDGPR